MLVVALFDGLATALVYTLVGVPHAGIWAAIHRVLALVPFSVTSRCSRWASSWR
jgi:predicted PurR-regulated permease PerM